MSDDRSFDPCNQGYHEYCVGTSPGEACACRCHLEDQKKSDQARMAALRRDHDACPYRTGCQVCFALDALATERARAEAAEGREARMREACDLLANTVGLLNSMVLCGEDHSETSRKVMRESLDAFRAALAGTPEVVSDSVPVAVSDSRLSDCTPEGEQ